MSAPLLLAPWQASLIDGRAAAIAAARHARKVAASVRSNRAYAWRAVGAGRLDVAALLRRAVVQVDTAAREDPSVSWVEHAWRYIAAVNDESFGP